MIFNSIWLKNRLYNSQIELFSFDLAIEYLVDAFLFYPFARSQYEIKAFGDSRGDKEMSCLQGKSFSETYRFVPQGETKCFSAWNKQFRGMKQNISCHETVTFM